MYRLFRVVALLLLVCSFGCGAEEPAGSELALDGAALPTLEVPFPIAVLTGRAGGAETLTLRVGASGETCTVPLRPGTAMAFRFEDEAEPSAVRLEGLDVETPSAGELVDRLRERLREAVPEASVRRPGDADVFVVDLPAGLEGRWAGVLDAVAPPSSVHFLIEVLPAQLYPFRWPEGETPPRLEKGPLPWAGTADEFRAFREEEVKRWVAARDTY